MIDRLDLLWPEPRALERVGGSFSCDARWTADAGPFGLEIPGASGSPPSLRLVHAAHVPPAGYELEVDGQGGRASARDAAGARHALATFTQIVALHTGRDGRAEIPGLRIRDEPAFSTRGVMLDVSRGRVPRTEALDGIAEHLAAWKVDHLQLYFEHAFAYAGHEDVWRAASPFTPDEVRSFDDRCAARGIELAPNQQSFGHFHRWLKHARYRDLAEVPAGVEHAFSLDREPYSLDLGDPRAIALLEDLYDQLLPCFRSGTFNVGLDETFDLGLGKSKAACAERGVERVYLEYLRRVHELVTRRGRRMQFWGDVILQRPELVPELPRDLVALEWGYDAGHPFAEHVERFRAAGLEFWVCPGTSSWQSFGGRARNGIANLREAAAHGVRAGARGMLVTDWGDRGHHQPHCVRDWGLLAGAGLSWNPDANLDEARLARLLDAHVYADDAGELGLAAMELANVYLETGSPATNGSALFFLVAFAPDAFPHPRTPDLSRAGLECALDSMQRTVSRIERSRSTRADAPLLCAEMRWIASAQALGADLGIARLEAGAGVPLAGLPARARGELAQQFRAVEAEHERIWLARDRPGGLDESLRWFRRVRAGLEAAP
ncbi:MAG: family 20 glycosylhydrolase [Planctomycetota bacterium]|nr:family 20 glycosylhydrolase [Planctomycetota bacterium]